jgi:ergothioneine biosynthesis protein EgtB
MWGSNDVLAAILACGILMLVPPEVYVYSGRMRSEACLLSGVLATRRSTLRLCEPLDVEDCVAQSMPDASPVKWHLAHTTWFFERFVLAPLGIPPARADADYLFNSYYESVGARHPRRGRGLLTRPSLADVLEYRRAVDARLADLEGSPGLAEIAKALELGRNHEEQHQELILTDVKHLFGSSPLLPAYRPPLSPAPVLATPPLRWLAEDGGLLEIGHAGDTFAFDNERPRHKVYLAPFAFASRLVTAGEYLDFVRDGGYRRADLWLSEGWAWVQQHAKAAPLYWRLDGDDAHVFTLRGERPVIAAEPVCHVSYYEAEAFARWAGARLPTEPEWEVVASRRRGAAEDGLFADDPRLHPAPARGEGLAQTLGDAWEWTQSAYAPYPGFRPFSGAFAEYNGKFMVSQMVLRGGSAATPRDHVRATYRNFFPPDATWQLSGIRLARDA